MILRVKSSTKTRIHHLQTTYLRVQNREQRICRQTRSDFYERKKQRIKLQRKSAKIDQGQAKQWTFWLNSDVEIGTKSAQWSWRGTSIASTIDDQHSYTVSKKIVRDFGLYVRRRDLGRWSVLDTHEGTRTMGGDGQLSRDWDPQWMDRTASVVHFTWFWISNLAKTFFFFKVDMCSTNLWLKPK